MVSVGTITVLRWLCQLGNVTAPWSSSYQQTSWGGDYLFWDNARSDVSGNETSFCIFFSDLYRQLGPQCQYNETNFHTIAAFRLQNETKIFFKKIFRVNNLVEVDIFESFGNTWKCFYEFNLFICKGINWMHFHVYKLSWKMYFSLHWDFIFFKKYHPHFLDVIWKQGWRPPWCDQLLLNI